MAPMKSFRKVEVEASNMKVDLKMAKSNSPSPVTGTLIT